MRPGQQKQRSRGRGNGSNNNNQNNQNRKGQNPLTRTYDSSGPDVKIRGTAQHIAEKYAALARDAHSSGDRVMAENYLQHAEHYNRIIAAAQAMFQERFGRDDRSNFEDRNNYDDRDSGMDGDDNDGGDMDDVAPMPIVVQKQQQPEPMIDGSGPQPVIEGTPAEVAIEEVAANSQPRGDRGPVSRRRGAGRPRRQPRQDGAAAPEGAEQPEPAGETAE